MSDLLKNEVETTAPQTAQDKVSERLNQIQSAMENISSSDEFKKYLETMGKFHDYSFNNVILIALQNPEATHVAGYNQWQSRFERHVKEGEKGIEILAPNSRLHIIQKDMFSDDGLKDFLRGEPVKVILKDKKNNQIYDINKNMLDNQQLSMFLEGFSVVEFPIINEKTNRNCVISKNMLDDYQLKAFLNGESVKVPAGYSGYFVTSLRNFNIEDIPKFLEGRTIREEKGFVTWFKPVKVFDISQTDGKELPKSPIHVSELKGEVANFDSIMKAIQSVSPCKIEFVKAEDDHNLQKGAKGYYMRGEERIVLKEGMSQLQTLKTAIHEVAHSKLHNEERLNKLPLDVRPDRRDKEIQAESVACAACYYFGLDTSEYSFGYVAGWASANVEKFKTSMQLIQETSSEIITAIDKELQPEKYQQKAKEQEQVKEKRKEYAQNKNNQQKSKPFKQTQKAKTKREEGLER